MTAANREEAARLAQKLVTEHLAACVQILPEIESVYRWQGNIERQGEVLLIAKTVRSKFAELEAAVCAQHSYETPEIVAVPMAACSAPYLAWLGAATEASEVSVSTTSESANHLRCDTRQTS